jgi:hypothetical protein
VTALDLLATDQRREIPFSRSTAIGRAGVELLGSATAD